MAITPFKVTKFSTNQKPICDFLLVINTPCTCTVSKLWLIIGQIFASDRRVLHFNETRMIFLPDAEKPHDHIFVHLDKTSDFDR